MIYTNVSSYSLYLQSYWYLHEMFYYLSHFYLIIFTILIKIIKLQMINDLWLKNEKTLLWGFIMVKSDVFNRDSSHNTSNIIIQILFMSFAMQNLRVDSDFAVYRNLNSRKGVPNKHSKDFSPFSEWMNQYTKQKVVETEPCEKQKKQQV